MLPESFIACTTLGNTPPSTSAEHPPQLLANFQYRMQSIQYSQTLVSSINPDLLSLNQLARISGWPAV